MGRTLSHVQATVMALSNRLSYPGRLFLWLLGYSILLVGCFVAFQYNREKEFKAAEMDARLQLINDYILNELAEGRSIEDIRLNDFHPFDDLRVSVISEDGEVMYDNALDSIRRANHLDREEIKSALKHNSGYAVRRHSESTGETYFYSATKGNDGRIVRTAVPYSLSLDSLLQADYGFIWVMGAVTFIMCMLGYIATRRVGLHILRLKRFAESVESGAKISDTEPFPHDELGDISNHIVRLYAKLQQAYSDRDNEHRAALHEQQEKERIKKQLTNNINHELKTPVASIQVCVETLMTHNDMSDEKKDMFLQRCMSNIERLRRLLSDVSLVTRMDDGGAAIIKESVDLSAIISDVVADRMPIAQEKGITIENYVSGSLEMTGNPSLLESVFNNLIDNSIAYSGGTLISIRLVAETDQKITISFCDNGCGVPEEHLPRIFERFYRIDKGRSRAAGGTGLGLAIVKNAVHIHSGTIKAENTQSGGLEFRISFSRV